MEVKHFITKIVDDGNREKMEELSDILDEVVNIIKKYDDDCYREYLLKLHKMAYGNGLTEDEAMDIVKKMKPYGQRWNIDETEKIQNESHIDNINPIDFYIVMNQGFNDYRDIWGDNLDMYIRYANAFINDEDAVKDKVLKYFIYVPK